MVVKNVVIKGEFIGLEGNLCSEVMVVMEKCDVLSDGWMLWNKGGGDDGGFYFEDVNGNEWYCCGGRYKEVGG